MLSKEQIREIYKSNEDQNRHTENIYLLVFHFGTEEEKLFIKALLRYNEYKGHGGAARDEKHELHKKYYGKLFDSIV